MTGEAQNIGSMRVTRNVPPKRGIVTPGTTIVHAGVELHEGDEILAAGPEIDQLALDGYVTVASHDETDAWNGKEGRALHKRAMTVVAADSDGDATHDHGFGRYEHGDPKIGLPVDVTSHAEQQAAKEQQS